MSGSQDAEEYFDLIVECAKRLMATKPPNMHPVAFWRQETGKAWRSCYQHMARPDERFGVWKSTAYRRELAYRFAAVSRMAAMAAWWIGVQQEDGEDDPYRVAKALAEMGQMTYPKLR